MNLFTMSSLYTLLILLALHCSVRAGILHLRTFTRVKRDTCSCTTQYTPVNCRCNTDWQSGELLCRCDRAAVLSPSNCACSSIGQPLSSFPQSRRDLGPPPIYSVPPSMQAQCQPACQQKCYQTCGGRQFPPPPLYPPPPNYPYPMQQQPPMPCPPGQCQSTCQRACAKMANPATITEYRPSTLDRQCVCEPGDEDCQCGSSPRQEGLHCYQLCSDPCEESCRQQSVEAAQNCESSCRSNCLRNCDFMEGPAVQPPAKFQTPLSPPPSFPSPSYPPSTRVGPQQALSVPQRHLPVSSIYGNGVSVVKGAGGSHYLTSVSQQPHPHMASLVLPSRGGGLTKSQNSLAPMNNNWPESGGDMVGNGDDYSDGGFTSGCLTRCPESCERACSALPGSTAGNCQPACVSMCGQSCQQHDSELLLARGRMDALMDEGHPATVTPTLPKTGPLGEQNSTAKPPACAPLCQPACLEECTSKYMEKHLPLKAIETQQPKSSSAGSDARVPAGNDQLSIVQPNSATPFPIVRPDSIGRPLMVVNKKDVASHIAQRRVLLDAVSKSLARMAELQREVKTEPLSRLKGFSAADSRPAINTTLNAIMHAPPRVETEAGLPESAAELLPNATTPSPPSAPTTPNIPVQPSELNGKIPNFFDKFLLRRKELAANKLRAWPTATVLNATFATQQQQLELTPAWKGIEEKKVSDHSRASTLTPPPSYAAAMERKRDRNWYIWSLLGNPSTHSSSNSSVQTSPTTPHTSARAVENRLVSSGIEELTTQASQRAEELMEEKDSLAVSANPTSYPNAVFPRFDPPKIHDTNSSAKTALAGEFRAVRLRRASPSLTTSSPAVRPSATSLLKQRQKDRVTAMRPTPPRAVKKTKGFQLSASCHGACRRMCAMACKPPRGKAKTADLHRRNAECSSSCSRKCWAKCGRSAENKKE